MDKYGKGYLSGERRGPLIKAIVVVMFLRNGNLAELKKTVIGIDA
jgi:hypothetical protein